MNGTGPDLSTRYPIAELDRRFYAFAIDRLLGWILVALVGVGAWFVLHDAWLVVAVVIGVMTMVWLVLGVLLGVTGNSPGKSMVGLRIVHHGTGEPIGVGRALLRSLVLAMASLPTFGLGLVTLAWTAVADHAHQRRGWHDHLAQSVVLDVRPIEAREVAAVDDAPRHVVNLTAMRLIPAPPVEAAAPPRRASAEHSVRRQPVGSGATPQTQPPVPMAPQPPAHLARPAPDEGRTVVRPRPGAPVGPRWRVTFDNGETFVVEGLALVGRRPEPRSGEQVHHLVPLSSHDMSVSKTHAQFGPTGDGVLVVMDRGSTNGSVLIRQGVSRPLTAGRPTTLVDGDAVSFGDRTMTVARES